MVTAGVVRVSLARTVSPFGSTCRVGDRPRSRRPAGATSARGTRALGWWLVSMRFEPPDDPIGSRESRGRYRRHVLERDGLNPGRNRWKVLPVCNCGEEAELVRDVR